jgi:hypothetical protein
MVISGTRWKRSSNRRKHFYANSSNNAFASFRSRVSKTGTVTGILQRQQRADRIKGAYVFINERGMSVASPSAGWPNGEPPSVAIQCQKHRDLTRRRRHTSAGSIAESAVYFFSLFKQMAGDILG